MRTFQDLILSLWQSAVAESFATVENSFERENASEATAEYCEQVFRRLEAGQAIVLDEILAALTEGQPATRDLRFLSALNHHLAMAQSQDDHELASATHTKLRPFEEGAGNLYQWKKCIVEYLKYTSRVRNGPMYRSPAFDGHLMENFSVIDGLMDARNIRIALVGDWGTGEAVAARVLDGILSLHPDLLIHLGDVYFSGTENECYQRFYDLIRSRKNAEELPVFVLAGNHDYYSGGGGFYQLLDHLNEGPARQSASFFCLRNNTWQLLAMDTGFKDSVPSKNAISRWSTLGRRSHRTDIRDDEFKWHEHQLNKTGGRRTILLSHHQLFSAYHRIGSSRGKDSVNDHLLGRFQTTSIIRKPTSHG